MAKKTNKDPAPEQVQQPAPEAATIAVNVYRMRYISFSSPIRSSCSSS